MNEDDRAKAIAAAKAAAHTAFRDSIDHIATSAVEAFEAALPADKPTVPPEPKPEPEPDPKPPKNFRVFEDINYRGRPNLRGMGMEPIQIHYESAFFDDKARPGEGNLKMPDRTRIQMAAERSRPVSVIDIERWWGVSDNPYPAPGIDNLEQTADIYRAALPQGHKFGFYGTVPIRSYWKPFRGGGDEADWKKSNDALRGIGELVDYTFPSIYTFYEGRTGWLKYARAQIEEAKRIAPGKPCYPFLWPEYHPGGNGPIEGDYWRMQLDLCRELADGVVIWTLSKTKNIDFRDIKGEGWWKQTEKFMEGLG